jgi:hypothetical protein
LKKNKKNLTRRNTITYIINVMSLFTATNLTWLRGLYYVDDTRNVACGVCRANGHARRFGLRRGKWVDL